MTKRVQIQEHLKTLVEIDSIMSAIKNLSLIEINKTIKNVATQERVHHTICEMGVDLLGSYPELFQPFKTDTPQIYILVGSERGFCSGFNESILRKMAAIDLDKAQLVIIGRKLSDKFMGNFRVAKVITGCTAIQEIDKVISSLLEFLSSTQTLANQWAIIYNTEQKNGIETDITRPLVEFSTNTKKEFSCPPFLYQPNEIFIAEFINHYLFSFMYHVFFKSFLAENYQRVRHLENALNQLDKQTITLKRHLNLIRQEDITEEIEIIILTVENMLKMF